MTAPKRIRLSRKKGYRKPEGAVVVARPTKWGNPYLIPEIHDLPMAERRRLAVEYFEIAIHPAAHKDTLPEYPLIADIERELAGKDLACWCPLDQPCHGDVLLKIANKGVS